MWKTYNIRIKDRLIINLKYVQIRWSARDRNYTEDNKKNVTGNVLFALDLDLGRERTLSRKVHTNARRWDQLTGGEQAGEGSAPSGKWGMSDEITFMRAGYVLGGMLRPDKSQQYVNMPQNMVMEDLVVMVLVIMTEVMMTLVI